MEEWYKCLKIYNYFLPEFTILLFKLDNLAGKIYILLSMLQIVTPFSYKSDIHKGRAPAVGCTCLPILFSALPFPTFSLLWEKPGKSFQFYTNRSTALKGVSEPELDHFPVGKMWPSICSYLLYAKKWTTSWKSKV